MSVLNLAVRQRLLELFHAGIADLRDVEAQVWSSGNPLRCSSPASLTFVLLRYNTWSWVNPLRCSSPASLTFVPVERQPLELGQSFEVFQPGVADLRVVDEALGVGSIL